jgi:hypothetical protein
MDDGCCTPVLYGNETGHLRRWKMACDLVGVAGFEPTASSSRSTPARLVSCSDMPPELGISSAVIRAGPSASGSVVTQFVTQRRCSVVPRRGAAAWARRDGAVLHRAV